MDREAELEAFKTQINLSEYSAALGYIPDRKKSSRNCCVMKKEQGDKIIIGKGLDGHWIYYSIGDQSDSGSIIDFVQNRVGGSLGDVRRKLRPWVDRTAFVVPPVHPNLFAPDLEPVSKDLIQVQGKFAVMDPIEVHPYLEQGRGIPAEYLRMEKFNGRIFIDERGNAVFPHYNTGGVCGYELKNEDFTGFAPGGSKGLWFSNFSDRDRWLAISETAIDAISFAAQDTWQHTLETRFFSIGGEMNTDQPGFLISALQKMHPETCVVLALDNDEAGDLMAEKIKCVFFEAKISPERVFLKRPSRRGDDWNDTLRPSMAEKSPEVAPEP